MQYFICVFVVSPLSHVFGKIPFPASWIQMIEVRDSRTGYLLPARDGPGALPDVKSSWDVAAAVAAAPRPPPAPACPPEYPKYKFRHLKYKFRHPKKAV